MQPFESSCYYHIYNRGNNKENIFKSKENYFYFLSLVKKYLVPISSIYSYCLLPNHFHIILKLNSFNQLPLRIRSGKTKLHQPFSNLFNAYTKSINKKYGRTGSLFQKNLKRIKIDSEDYLKNLIIYVNTNSAHHKINDYCSYKFSSYLSLISNKESLLQRNEVLGFFDDIENFKYLHQIKNQKIEVIKELILE